MQTRPELGDATYDVAIVGCGPVGAMAANLFARSGLSVLVIEREKNPYPLPRAVHIDHEMMRLFQSIGASSRMMDRVRATEGHLHIGADHGVIRYMGTAGRSRPFGWSNDYFFFQPELEDELRAPLEAFPNVEMRFGAAFKSVAQDDTGACLTIVSDDQAETVRAQFVVACDGARSAVRRDLGIELEDLNFEEPWLVVDAEVDGAVVFPEIAGLPAEANLQELSVMVCDPKRPTTVVPGRGRHRRWEFMLLPGEDDVAMAQPERVAELLAPYLDGVSHTVVRAATYRFHGLVATQWQKGRVFLAGDAAHQTPPFFGQVLCHGFRDVANLAWKLALVLERKASRDLLRTYQIERDPHVRAVISAAVEAGRYICILDHDRATKRDLQLRQVLTHGPAKTAADLIPAIRAGVIAHELPAAGQRFIQPQLAGGRQMLDDVTGDGWRLFSLSDETAADAHKALTDKPPVKINPFEVAALDDQGVIAEWLEKNGAKAVLVRPDHYVFGAAPSAAQLIERLAQAFAAFPADPIREYDHADA